MRCRILTAAILTIAVVFCFSIPVVYDFSDKTRVLQKEYHAVWFSYSDWQKELSDLDEAEFTLAVDGILGNCKKRGLNTVILQLRAFGDAFYDSALFACSKYLGVKPDYDPLEIWLRLADRHGIAIEGWVNPFRMGKDADAIPEYAGKTPRYAPAENGYHWLDPADETTVKLILAGLAELAEYPLAGIQFDDYFYAGVSPQGFGYDAAAAKAALERLIKQVGEQLTIPFGISPQGNFTADGIPVSDVRQYTSLQSWCEQGYIDYLMPQVYYGFAHETAPFEPTVEHWCKLAGDTPLYIGLAAYKCGSEDVYAGSGRAEWMAGWEVIDAQIAALEGVTDGYTLFRYAYLDAE